MSDSEHDDEFEAYLKRRVPADKRVAPLDPLEPPPELDRIVIGKARKAIQGGSSIHLYRAPKWALPVGLAATILLSFAILLDLGVRAKRNDASLQAASGPSSGIPTSQSPTGAAAESQSVAPTAAAAPVSPAAAVSGANVSGADEEEASSDRARTRLARAEKAEKRARPEQEMANRAVQEIFVTGQRKEADVATSTPAPIAAVPAAPLAAAPPVPTEAAPTVTDKAVGRAASSAAGSEGASTKAANLDPASWLARIEKLRSEGHTAEAEREMKRFRSAYPDYALPGADTP